MEFPMIEAGWISLLPPLIAIVLALITKEVYSSLFIGLFSGTLIYAFMGGGGPVKAVSVTFDMMYSKIADNAYMIIFLALLWAVVVLVSKSGGSEAYGRWAGKRIRSKRSAAFATSLLGVLIFIDDGFNCLTVGTVMRPITDRLGISREKLAYIIDATAAPVCIIAPVSSWAVAVASEVSETGGFGIFLQTIPYNLYALLTIVMVIAMSVMNVDYGPMKKHEINAVKNNDLFTTGSEEAAEDAAPADAGKGKVIDLILPVVVLIVACVVGMIYTGGFFSGEGVSFVQAFSDSDASVGLVLGSFVALLFTLLLYLPRKVISFKECMNVIPQGFKAMVPSIIILIFAWTLGGFCKSYLGAGEFVANWIKDSGFSASILPPIMFLVALGLAFATGTSWGTFGILIPISLDIFAKAGITGSATTIVIAACLAGAVCGDHCSPISDTTIMASAGARCNHVNHVSTQLPYALTVAGFSFAGYALMAVIPQWFIVLPIMTALLLGMLILIKAIGARKNAA